MQQMCEMIGPERCMMVRYEDLVTDTETVVRKVTDWLGVEMEEDMLRHHQMMETVMTSSMETTGDQIVRPVYSEAVDRWKGRIPGSILADLNENNLKYSAALRQFGYAVLD